ncbi:glycosyltransferase family 4 protein [Pleurocapsales cyanobacterium LEGE 06147]|nr:glycosyltransferase family 4 protein [Pleurocapsales cyanobacterium LEGE 06147]
MKIAVIGVKGLPATQGGIERYCEELYSRLVARGHSVDLFARSSYIQQPWFSIYHCKGVRVICLPSLPLRGLDALTSSAIGALVSTIKDYDVVHFHALGPALFSWLPRIVSSARIIVTCQGLDWQRAKWGKLSRKIIYWGERAAVKYAHELVVVSEALVSYFQKTYSRETAYIPNGPGKYAESDPQFTYIRSLNLKPKNYILFLGRLVPEKRPDLLLEAFQKLQPQGWKLAFVGGVSDTARFTSKLVKIADNNPNIIFTGELQGKYLAEVVRGAGLFVLPSDLEGLPLVVLEAMREGIPIVASDIPPHRQLLAQDRGLLFEAGNVDFCIHSLQQALAQPLEMANRASKAQKYVAINYNWDKIAADNLAVYTNPLKKDKKTDSSPIRVGNRKRDAV